jgi:hypothetical protein
MLASSLGNIALARITGPSFSVVIEYTSAGSRAKKDGFNAQDHTFSAVWQAVFSTRPQTPRLVSLSMLLVDGFGDCRELLVYKQ